MTVTQLNDYRDKYKDRPILGLIGWYSARQTLIPLSKIRADLEAIGLGKYVPKATAVSDQWRKATSAAARKGLELGGKRINVLVRKLADTEDEIVRSIVIETVDEKGKVLEYQESAHVIFDKASETMRVKQFVPLGGPADEVIQQLEASFAARLANGGCKDQDDLRTLVTETLKGLNAVTVRETGGVLFVPREQADIVAKLEQVTDQWPGMDFHSLPLIDDVDQKQRGVVGAGVTATVLLEAEQLMTEIREHKDKLSTRRQGSILRRQAELGKRLRSYQALLEDNLSDAAERLQLLDLSISQVLKVAA